MILSLGASIAALSAALIAQYGFGLLPCVLCLYQRAPYVVAILLAGLGLLPAMRRYRAILFLMLGLTFLGNSGLAFYHVGIENHWWAGTQACGGTARTATTTADLLSALDKPVQVIRCAQPAWTLFGLSMAGYNVIFSALLSVHAFYRRFRP